MNDVLSLWLELLDQAPECLRFRLTFCNQSDVKMLFPFPEIHGLRFRNIAAKQESEWYTRLLVSASWAGFTLLPGEEKVIEYRVRPHHIEAPRTDDHSDYYRWCVELPPGEYSVWFRFEVGDGYFCPDSHYRYDDLLREAKEIQAKLWKGQVQSNQLYLIR